MKIWPSKKAEPVEAPRYPGVVEAMDGWAAVGEMETAVSCKDPPHLFGGYSEYVYLHPRAMVHKNGDSISPEVGVLVCAVLGNGVRWLRQVGGVSIGDTAVILGPGLQGLAGVCVAKESGADPVIVIGLSRDKSRLEMAKRFRS